MKYILRIQLEHKQDVIRDIEISDLEGINAIIHLAGLSNDPLGELNEKLTYKINFDGTINLIEKAKIAGVKNFLYASTQSVYGISENIEKG